MPICPNPPLLRSLVSAACLAASGTALAEDFSKAVEMSIAEHYSAPNAVAQKLVVEDQMDNANLMYLRAVPDDKLTPADCYVLGNTFYRMEDELAQKYHRRAYEALPEEPLTNLEWGMCLHRAGKPAEALPHYQKFLATNPSAHVQQALAADCLLRTGKLKEAVETWRQADHPTNHTGIDFTIFEIYGEAKPFKRRDDLLKAVRAGDKSKIDDLFRLSANWDRDWWNSGWYGPFLKRDTELAKQLLPDQPEKVKELEQYAQTYTTDMKGDVLKKFLEEQGWILGDKGRLPATPLVADRVVGLAIAQKLADEKTLLERFEGELRRRALDPGANDVVSLNILANLLVSQGEARRADLAAVDQAGWDRYHDARFAASLLGGQRAQGALRADSPAFLKAMKEFPENQPLSALGLTMAEEDRLPILEPLVAAMKAEFRHLSRSEGATKDSYRLKNLFFKLETELEKQAPPQK